MDFGSYTLGELKQGYHYCTDEKAYICNYCGKKFAEGQVFSIDDGFYLPDAAVAAHVESEHEGCFHQLLHAETKYNTLTDKQTELLALFHSGMSDGEIAKRLNVTTSTIRHQKFTFREKAKQAKLYLAMFELAFDCVAKNDEAIVPIHDHAVYCDERYVITEQEKEQILKTSFVSLKPLKLKTFSPKEKKKVVILTKIAELFEAGRDYTEQEVNQLLVPVYDDYPTIRRYLVMYGFMKRNKDGSGYRLT